MNNPPGLALPGRALSPKAPSNMPNPDEGAACSVHAANGSQPAASPTFHRSLAIEVKSAAPESTSTPEPPAENNAPGDHTLDFISSDETLDRCEEIICPEGWDLRHYLQNPVFQNAHNYGDVIHTLGRAIITEIRERRLFQRIRFATEANPLARIAYGLYRGKFLNAVSVGFVPLEWEEGTKDTPWRRRYLRQELLEVSAVGIPANPNALALGLKSGAVAGSDIQELAELCRRSIETAQPAGDIRRPAALPDPQIISLAHALRDITRRM